MMAMVVPTKHLDNRVLKILFRLIAVIPPFTGAIIVKNLVTSMFADLSYSRTHFFVLVIVVISYVGVIGFIIAFLVPALLQIFSKRKCALKYVYFNIQYVDTNSCGCFVPLVRFKDFTKSKTVTVNTPFTTIASNTVICWMMAVFSVFGL